MNNSNLSMLVSVEKLRVVFGDSFIDNQITLEQISYCHATTNLRCLKFCLNYLAQFHDPEIANIFENLQRLIEHKWVILSERPLIQEMRISLTGTRVMLLVPETFSKLFEEDTVDQLLMVFSIGRQAYHFAARINVSISEGRFLKLFFEKSRAIPNERHRAIIQSYETALSK